MDSLQRTKNKLHAIKDRYFRPVIANQNGLVVHHGDCDIYRSPNHHGSTPCGCGLLHDMTDLDYDYVERIYPDYSDDQETNETIWNHIPGSNFFSEPPPVCKPTKEEIRQLFESVDMAYDSTPRIIDEETIWNTIQEVFGEQAVKDMKILYDKFVQEKANKDG